jgi:hypothetical protein
MVLISDKYILVSIFNKSVTNIGIVRFKIKKYQDELEKIISQIEERAESEKSVSQEIDIEDIDLDTLFE